MLYVGQVEFRKFGSESVFYFLSINLCKIKLLSVTMFKKILQVTKNDCVLKRLRGITVKHQKWVCLYKLATRALREFM